MDAKHPPTRVGDLGLAQPGSHCHFGYACQDASVARDSRFADILLLDSRVADILLLGVFAGCLHL